MEQYMSAMIMVLITIATVLLLLLPIKLRFGTDLIKFYWRAFWCQLALIAVVAGSGEVLEILGNPQENYTLAILSGLMTSYILFVVFAWFRLIGVGFFVGIRKLNKTS